jgi:hypothetical protein
MANEFGMFPAGAVLYFLHRLVSFDGDDWQPNKLGVNILMFPHRQGYRIDLLAVHQLTTMPAGRAIMGVKHYAPIKRIEYFIFCTAGNHALREGFQHDFQPDDCTLVSKSLAEYHLLAPGNPLFKFFPIETVMDKVNANTGFKAMQFND